MADRAAQDSGWHRIKSLFTARYIYIYSCDRDAGVGTHPVTTDCSAVCVTGLSRFTLGTQERASLSKFRNGSTQQV